MSHAAPVANMDEHHQVWRHAKLVCVINSGLDSEGSGRDSVGCFMASAEPSWSPLITPSQLSGQLTLCALFSPTTYFSDVHIGDNPHLMKSFLDGERGGLYAKIKELAEVGVLRLLLRDETVLSPTDLSFDTVESFSDVLASWQILGEHRAGMLLGWDRDQNRYFAEVDSWATEHRAVDTYSYQDVKHEFMTMVRTAYGSGDLGAIPGAAALTSTQVSAFMKLAQGDWFSLADIYRVCKNHAIPISGDFSRFHSLIDEVAYGKVTDAALAGFDQQSSGLDRLLWNQHKSEDLHGMDSFAKRFTGDSVGALLERATAVLDAPDLSVLGLISAAEIMELRATGKAYFETLKLMNENPFLEANPDFGNRLALITAAYWENICDRLVELHPGSATRPTRLAVLLGRIPRNIQRTLGALVQFAVNVGIPGLAESTSGSFGASGGELVKRSMNTDASLRFVMIAETAEMKRIRSIMPNRGWVTAPAPQLYLPR